MDERAKIMAAAERLLRIVRATGSDTMYLLAIREDVIRVSEEVLGFHRRVPTIGCCGECHTETKR